MRKLSDLSSAELLSLALTNKRITSSKYDLQILDINPTSGTSGTDGTDD